MGYRDDFYVVKNIIGYTGSVRERPTVYFKSISEHGRITQKHDFSQNLGRQRVKSNDGYTCGNELVLGEVVFVERDTGETHESNGPLVPIDGLTEEGKGLIYQAIWQFPEEKRISTFAPGDRAKIIGADTDHFMAMQELLTTAAGR